MVSLSQMARLLEAVRPQARLILVGDPGQLTSIEAGAVLGDIVGPADDGPSSIVVLSRVHRFGGAIGAVAEAVRRGDADAAVEALSTSPDEVTWLPVDPETDSALAPVHDGAVGAARAVIDAARAGEAHRALEALASFRVLCAHRRGPYGVETWTDRIERWLANEVEGFGAEGQWYVGRPLLVTENDYGLRLYNGDTGVVVATDTGRVSAAFERRGELIEFSPTRLAAVDSVYAMTVHKSQGSQFATAAVLLPDPTSQHPHARAALHRGHARARAPDPRRHRGGGPGRRRAAGGARVGAALAAVGRRGSVSHRTYHRAPRAAPSMHDSPLTAPLDPLSAVALIALPAAARAATTVTIQADPGGRVTSQPAGIDCPGACVATFARGATLTAQPAQGYAFGAPNDNGAPGNKDGWLNFGGDTCTHPSGQPEVCSVPGDEPTFLTAHFRPAAQLDVVPSGRGSVTATIPAPGAGEQASQTCNGDAQGGVSCEYTYLPGREVTLVASPDTNEGPSSFVRWSDERCPAGPVCTLTMDAARQSIVALFTPQRVSVRVRGDRAGDEHAGRPRLPGRRRPRRRYRVLRRLPHRHGRQPRGRRHQPALRRSSAGVVPAVRLRRRQRLRDHRGSRALGGGRLRRPGARHRPGAADHHRALPHPEGRQRLRQGPGRFDRLRRKLHGASGLRGAPDPDRDARRRVALRRMAQRLLERRDLHARRGARHGRHGGVRHVVIVIVTGELLVVGRPRHVDGVQGEPGSARGPGPRTQARGRLQGPRERTGDRPRTAHARASHGRQPQLAGQRRAASAAPPAAEKREGRRVPAQADGARRIRSRQELRPEPAHPAVNAHAGHAPPSEQPRALAVRIARVVSSTIGLAATILGIVFVLWPSLKPEGPPAARSATLSNVTLDRSVAFGQYLDRIKLTRAPYTPATLSRRGAYVEFDYAIAGYKGKRLPLRWQLVDARTADQLAQSEDLGIKAQATTDRGTWFVWVPLPHGHGRRFFVQIQLYKQDGRVPLSRVRTVRFAGT